MGNWGKILILIPIFAILIGCGRIAFVFEFGYPLRLEKSDFTVENPKNQSEIAYTFINSVAFHNIEGIKPYVAESEWGKLNRIVEQIEPATSRCRYPFDPVLSFGTRSQSRESISIHYECPDEESFIKFNTYTLSTTLYFYEDERGHLIIKHWCDTRQGYGTEIGLSCLIKNLRNP